MDKSWYNDDGEYWVLTVFVDISHHKQGIGKALFNRILQWAKERGYEYLQVKTLDESHPDMYYSITRKFYLSIGFRPLECFPVLWGEANPCLIMIRRIE